MEKTPKRARKKRAPDAEGLRELAREKVPEALDAICRVLREDDVKHTERLRAAEIIMDRAYGKAAAKDGGQSEVKVVMEGFEQDWSE